MKKIIFTALVLMFFSNSSVLAYGWCGNSPFFGVSPVDWFGTICVSTSWSPARSTVCLGQSFTQTGNCGDIRPTTGTKTCSGTMCSTPAYSCSTANVWSKYSNWLTNTCSSGNCSYQITTVGGCNSSQDCGTATCQNSYDYEYCNNSEIRAKTMGYDDICRSDSSGCGTSLRECNDYFIEECQPGYICRITGVDPAGRDDAECIPKSSSWTED